MDLSPHCIFISFVLYILKGFFCLFVGLYNFKNISSLVPFIFYLNSFKNILISNIYKSIETSNKILCAHTFTQFQQYHPVPYL